jgi:hypothetical protein
MPAKGDISRPTPSRTAAAWTKLGVSRRRTDEVLGGGGNTKYGHARLRTPIRTSTPGKSRLPRSTNTFASRGTQEAAHHVLVGAPGLPRELTPAQLGPDATETSTARMEISS